MATHKLLIPREHGAWVQLALPLLAVVILGAPGTASAWLLTVASVLAFVAHESLLVVIGSRGGRAKVERGDRARRLLAILGSGAAAAGIAGLVLGGLDVMLATLSTLVPTVLLIPLLRQRREKTTPGELLAAAARAGLSLPVGLAAGLPFELTAIVWLFWVAAFAVETLAARGVLAMAGIGLVSLIVLLVGPVLG